MNKVEKEWSKKVSSFNKSGKSKEEWCRENNISTRQFGYWLKHLSKNEAKKWLPVEIAENSSQPYNLQKEHKNSESIPINIKIAEVSIEIFPGVNKDFLIDILKTLKTL